MILHIRHLNYGNECANALLKYKFIMKHFKTYGLICELCNHDRYISKIYFMTELIFMRRTMYVLDVKSVESDQV